MGSGGLQKGDEGTAGISHEFRLLASQGAVPLRNLVIHGSIRLSNKNMPRLKIAAEVGPGYFFQGAYCVRVRGVFGRQAGTSNDASPKWLTGTQFFYWQDRNKLTSALISVFPAALDWVAHPVRLLY